MKNQLVVLIILICIAELTSGQQRSCQLLLGKDKERKLTKLQRAAVNALKLDVTYDCENVECNPIEDAEVEVEKFNKTGCRCQKEEKEGVTNSYGCRCCFRIKKWDFLICLASALEVFDPYKFSIFVTFDGQVFSRLSIPLQAIADKYIPLCIPAVLPPPLHWLSPCFKFKFEFPSTANNNTWRICGKIKIGIYIVPVWTIYTKCFEISSKIDSMKIEGQTTYDEDVEEPATIKVNDKNNMLPLVCLSNKKKERMISCKSSRDGAGCSIPVKPIEVESRVNWKESNFERAPFVVLLYTENNLIPVQDLHDDDAYPFLREAMQEAEAQQWMESSPPSVDSNPAASCGGALLTADKVLTLCGCVRSFYVAHKLKKEVDDDEVFQFDIMSNEIRLKLSDNSLANDKRVLDTDGKKMAPDSMCSKSIESNQPAEILQTTMIVMPFTPTVGGSEGLVASWPPGVLTAGPIVSLDAYGMTVKNSAWFFKTKSGEKVDFQKTAVEFFLKKCSDDTEYCTELSKDKVISEPTKKRLACMCAAMAEFQLFGGEIGFPLTADGQLLGLTSLPVDNGTEGSTLGVVFDDTTIQEIENYVGKANLRTTTPTSPTATDLSPKKPTTARTHGSRRTSPPSSVVGTICQSSSSIIQISILIAVHYCRIR